MTFSPIFLIYLAFLLILLFFGDGKLKAVIIYVTFILLFEGSSFGADYNSYKVYYETNCAGLSVERLYYSLTYYLHTLGMPYEVFRLLWGSIWVGLICYSLYRMNKKYFNVSFLLLYMGYPLYTLSVLRQLAVMAIAFWGVYRMFFKNDFILPVCASYIGAFFHKSGYIVFAFFVACDAVALIAFIYAKIRKRKVSFALLSKLFTGFCKKFWLPCLPVLLILRLAIYVLASRQPFASIFASLVSSSYDAKTLFSFGVVSRGILLVLTMWMYPYIDRKKEVGGIMFFYTVCLIGYIVFPYETFSGRLFNNGRILECALIPLIYSRLLPFEKSERKLLVGYNERCVLPMAKTYLFLCLAVYGVMFIRQLTGTLGYSDYTNIFPFLNF